MYFPSSLLTVFLLILTTTLYFVNSTTTTTTTTTVSVVKCDKQSLCLTNQYCNITRSVCMAKQAINSSCKKDVECSGNECHHKICRQPCSSENNCSLTKEYCTYSSYCEAKYCGFCTRNVQCANNKCSFLSCNINECHKALEALRKQP
jgi:hypothetical protein